MGLNGLDSCVGAMGACGSSYLGVWICFDDSVDLDLDNRLYCEYIVKQCLLCAPPFGSTLFYSVLFLSLSVSALSRSLLLTLVILWLIKNLSTPR